MFNFCGNGGGYQYLHRLRVALEFQNIFQCTAINELAI